MIHTQVNGNKMPKTAGTFLWEERTGLGKVSLHTSSVFPVYQINSCASQHTCQTYTGVP